MSMLLPLLMAGIGAGGAALGAFGGKDKKTKFKQLDLLNPQQKSYLSQILGGLQGPTQEGFNYLGNILSDNPEAFTDMEAPHLRNFKEQTIPQLAELFSGVGGQKSSAFQNQLGQAGAALQENLAAQRSGLKQNALSALLGFSGQGLGTRAFETIGMGGGPNALRQFGNSLAPLAGQGLGGLMQFQQLKQLLPLLSKSAKVE